MPVNDFSSYALSWRPARAALGAGPVYLALASALERDIVQGRLPPGTRLPPQRELADFLDLNFTTVTRAYDLCREKNLIYGVTGKGTFVSSLPGVEEDAPAAPVDLGVVQGFASLGARAVVGAAREVLSRPDAEGLFSYASRDGRARVREAGRLWLSRAGVDAAHVAVFPGVQGALASVLMSVFRPGEALAVDAHTYANLIGLARMARVRLVAVPGDQEGMDPEALQKSSVRGVFLMPSQANPTARTVSERRRDALAAVIRARGLLLIEDDARMGTKGRPLQARVPERTIYLAGSSRLVAPGLRATFAAFPEGVRAPLLAGLHHTAIKASSLEAEILAELVLGGTAERILAKKRQAARKANDVFNRVFKTKGPKDDDRLFRTLPLPETAGRGEEIERRFLAAGVRVFHSDRFRVASAAPDAFLRVSVSNARSEKELEEALKRLHIINGV